MWRKGLTTIIIILIFQGCIQEENSSAEQDNQTTEKSESKVTKNLISKREYVLRGVEDGTVTVQKEGNNFNIANSETQLVLFDFFTTWCPACRAVAPHLSNIQAKYPKEIKVIGVLIEENKKDQDIIDFKEEFGAEYMISNSTGENENFSNFKFSNEMAALLRQPKSFPIPLLVLLKDGEYFTHYVGAVPEEMIESDIKEALGLRGEK